MVSYEYDEAGQLIRENNSSLNKTFVFIYDEGGNISSKQEYSYTTGSLPATYISSIDYTYDSEWKDKMVSYDEVPITYDEIGNPLSYGSNESFEWQGKQLKSYTKGGKKHKFFYNSDGYRTKRESYSLSLVNGVITETLDYTKEYVWNNDKLVAESMVSASEPTNIIGTKYLYDVTGSPYAMIVDEDTIYYFAKNQFGDIEKIISEDGNELAYYQYDAWGNPTFSVNSTSWSLGLSGLVIMAYNSLLYRGYCYDIDLGLYYLKSRYYNAQWGRFLNCDNIYIPTSSTIEPNFYAYCKNNPISQIDRNGNADGAVMASYIPAIYSALGAVASAASPAVAIIGTILLTAAIASYLVEHFQLSQPRTKTLTDTKAKLPQNGAYHLAYIDPNGNLIKTGAKMTFTQALVALGVSGAKNTLNQKNKFKSGKASDKVKQLRKKYENWGIYADSQSYAKALAVVFGCTDAPEVHGSGYYGHYHDSTHSFHIWYGSPISYM